MKKFLPITILILVFFLFKLSNFGIRLSDSNIYFYTGYKILQGKVLYKDIFFTNFPLLPYISSLYFLLTGGNLKLFFLTPLIEVCIVAFLIYYISYKKYKDIFLSLTSSILYLFSFIILSTSDHQSGVFIASLFAILSYYFYQNKKYLLTGVFIALALLTKVYFIPILLSYITLFLFPASQRGEEKKFKNLQSFLVGGVIASLIILLPTLLFAFPDFIKDVFVYSLTRSQGIGKSAIFWFFITHDFTLFVLLVFNLFTIQKNKFFGLVSLFGIVFLIFYQDVYFLYLNFLIPFLALSYPEFYKTMQKSFGVQKFIIPTVLFCLLIFSITTYMTGFRNLQKIDLEQEVAIIKKENPKFLYGVNDIAPGLSHLTGILLLNNVIDTNANIYRKGYLSSKKMTQDAIFQQAILVTHGYDYPENGVKELAVDEIFDLEQIKKHCKLIGSFPVQTESAENRLNLLKCN